MRKFTFLMILSFAPVFAIPQQINYQGKLTDDTGVALDGSYDLVFRIYDAPTGGTLLWSETHSGTSITKGLFDVVLGETNPITMSFDAQYYLEIEVEGETMSPRIPLTSVGYSFRAGIADSLAGGGSGGGITDINSQTGPSITITNGTGISVSSAANTITITNTAPDQTVSIGSGTGISVSGSYPNFTITNTAPWTSSSNDYIQNQHSSQQSGDGFWTAGDGRIDGGNLLVDSPSYPGRDYEITCAARQDIYAANDLVEHVSGNKCVITGVSGGANDQFQVAGVAEGTKIFVVDGNDQRVGIGTTTPAYKLDVRGDAYIQSNLIIDINGDGWGFRAPFGSSAAIDFRPSSGSGSFQVGSSLGRNGVMTFGGAYWCDMQTLSGDPSVPSYDAGNIFGMYPTSAGIRWYNGTSWSTISGGASGITSINSQSGPAITMAASGTGLSVAAASNTITYTLNSGNASGQIPISNGTVCTNLNADMVDGHHYDSDWNLWNDAGSYIEATNNTDVKVYDTGSSYDIYVYKQDGTDGIYVYTTSTEYGADESAIFGRRSGTSGIDNGGTGWTESGVDCGVKGYSYWGNKYTAGVAGFSYNDYDSSCGVIGGNNFGDYYGMLGYRDNYDNGTSTTTYYGGYFRCNSDSRPGYAVDAYSTGSSGMCAVRAENANSDYYTGWFWHDLGSGNPGLGTNADFYVGGTKSAYVPTQNYGTRALYCEESAEIYFTDYGSAKLHNGHCTVQIDPIFLQTVTINDNNPMKVFIQMTDECPNGVYVKKGKDSFEVIEQNGGHSDATFDYRIVAKRKGFETRRLTHIEPPNPAGKFHKISEEPTPDAPNGIKYPEPQKTNYSDNRKPPKKDNEEMR